MTIHSDQRSIRRFMTATTSGVYDASRIEVVGTIESGKTDTIGICICAEQEWLLVSISGDVIAVNSSPHCDGDPLSWAKDLEMVLFR